jgi:flavin reductase (DIM6/NTAB) family NADH-FMN oxidoreductase RutF
MSKQLWDGGALLAPVPPVLVTCGTMEKPNVLTVGWTGIVNTIPPKTYISIRPERFSYPIIVESGEFVINLPTIALTRAVDFCGVRSGRQLDKFAETGLTSLPAAKVNCPMLAQSPLSLECRVFQQIELGSHTMFLADIVAVDVDENLIDKTGKLHLERAGLLAYAHGEYFALGEKMGSFGFSVRKKPRRSPGANAPGPSAKPARKSCPALQKTNSGKRKKPPKKNAKNPSKA